MIPMKNALLVPGVFFLSLLSAIIIFAFFGGIALRYELAVPFQAGTSGLLLLCIVQKACYTFPFALMLAIIGVYAFLMRHPTKKIVALSLFLVCTIFTVTVIIPACCAQLSSIEYSIAAYKAMPSANKALTAFINKPLFLTLLRQGSDSLFYDIYAAYTTNFALYLFFVCTFLFCSSSFWFVCNITQWNLLNILCLYSLSGAFLLVYPYMQQSAFRTVLANLYMMNSVSSSLRKPIIFCIVAVIFHSIGGLNVLLTSSKQKRSAL